MNWKSEEEKADEEVGKAIIRREELLALARDFTIAFIEKGTEKPEQKGWDAAMSVFNNLNKVTPLPNDEA